MSVAKVREARTREPEAGRRSVNRKDEREFDALIEGHRGRARKARDDADPSMGMPSAAAMLLAAFGGTQHRGLATQPLTEAARAPEGERLFLQKFEQAGGAAGSVELPKGSAISGNELRLRIANGPWQGLELQARLHAAGITMALRPADRAQEKRLQEASGKLSRELSEQMGVAIHMEIRHAAR